MINIWQTDEKDTAGDYDWRAYKLNNFYYLKIMKQDTSITKELHSEEIACETGKELYDEIRKRKAAANSLPTNLHKCTILT